MRTFKRSLVAGALALAVSAPAAAQFSGVYFFGDSLTDMGSFKPVLPPGTGMFTTNPGPVWALPFAQHFGFTASPANQGGNDYAYGGANVTATPGYPDVPPTSAAVPIVTQITQHLAKGPVDAKALYSVWGGANDLNATLEKVFAGQMTQAEAQAYMAGVAKDLVTQVARLSAAGAKYIIVVDVPDVGKTPDAVQSGQAASISAFAQYFNGLVVAGLNQLGAQTIRLNTYKLLDEVMANPSAYGFTNSTQRACGTTDSLLCTPANFVAPNASQTYIYADGHHPTTALSAIFAQYAESMIDGPQQIASLGDAPFRAEDANYRALDGRMWSGLDSQRPPRKLEAWVAYDYGSIDMQAGPNNGTGHGNTIAVGGDMKINDHLLAGVMFDYTETNGDFGGAGGGFKLRQPVFTGYAGYGDGPWYVGATLGAGSLDYNDVNRNIDLGAAVRNESGQTRGYEYTARLLGGYWFKYQDILHGPYAQFTYTKAIVRQFSEVGADSTALTYGQQDNDQQLWSLGWQVAGKWGSVRPFARVTWQYDSASQDRNVSASSNTLGGWYTIPAPKPDNSYALFNVGASADFGGVTGYVSGSGTAARGDGNYWAVTVGLRMPL